MMVERKNRKANGPQEVPLDPEFVGTGAAPSPAPMGTETVPLRHLSSPQRHKGRPTEHTEHTEDREKEKTGRIPELPAVVILFTERRRPAAGGRRDGAPPGRSRTHRQPADAPVAQA